MYAYMFLEFQRRKKSVQIFACMKYKIKKSIKRVVLFAMLYLFYTHISIEFDPHHTLFLLK
jgi:hypothetical protein